MPRIILANPPPKRRSSPKPKPAIAARIVRHGKFWAPAEKAPPVGTRSGEDVWRELVRRVREDDEG